MRASVFHLKNYIRCLKELKFRCKVVYGFENKDFDVNRMKKMDAEIAEIESDIKILEGVK